MAPSVLAGQRPVSSLVLDALPLARAAGVRWVQAPVEGFSVEDRAVRLVGRPPISGDVVSFNVGATVGGSERWEDDATVLPSRPLRGLVERTEALLPAWRRLGRPVDLVVVGGGAGGIEVAAAWQARLRREGIAGHVTLLHRGPLGVSHAMAARVVAAFRARGIAMRQGEAAHVKRGWVTLASGEAVAADAVAWVTGAQPHAWLSQTGLPCDDAGFLRVDAHMQVAGHPGVFAVGDCATQDDAAWVRRAGVWAVRAGPHLMRALPAALAGRALPRFRPQRDVLVLLNLGEGRAIGGKWGTAFEGRWVWAWKERLDTKFVERFQRLSGPRAPDLAAIAAATSTMACAGCAAKVAPGPLAQALVTLTQGERDTDADIGVAEGDDVAQVRLDGASVVASVDAFPPLDDDPFLHGELAALHACADLVARRARPTAALALVVEPRGAHPRDLRERLEGITAGLCAAGAVLVGGHTVAGDTALVGVTALGSGPVPRHRLDTPCALVLTRPVGAGVLARADALGLLPSAAQQAWLHVARTPVGLAAVVLDAHGAWQATDVSGFGLGGHAAALAVALRATAVVWSDAVPLYADADRFWAAGFRSSAHAGNAARDDVRGEGDLPWLWDPQTCGGLLAAVPFPEAGKVVAALAARGVVAAVIGTLHPEQEHAPPQPWAAPSPRVVVQRGA
jgi:selenide,water dikinase